MIAHVDWQTGKVRQRMSYDSYGTMRLLAPGDYDGDGLVNSADQEAMYAACKSGQASGDFNGDGTADMADYDAYFAYYQEETAPGWKPDEVRVNYAGYIRDPLTGLLLARNRWYEPLAGRWITRDPAGYVDGLDLYLYVRGNPWSLVDPTGLDGEPAEEYEYDVGRDRVGVTRFTNSRTWGGAFKNFISAGFWDPGTVRTERETTVYRYDDGRYMPNGLSAEEHIKYNQTGKLPHGASEAAQAWVQAQQKLKAEGLEQGKRAGQNSVFEGAAMAATPIAAKAVKKGSEAIGITEATEGGVGGIGNKARPNKEITLDPTKHPEAVKHLEDAGAIDRPLPVNRAAASKNRKEALRGMKKIKGKDLDEAPPAVLRNPGDPVSVRPIAAGDNRSGGATLGRQLDGVKDGDQVIIKVKPNQRSKSP